MTGFSERAGRSLGLLLLSAGAAFADAPAATDFCIKAQRIIAGTSIDAQLEVHQDFDSFVDSKAFDSPLTVQQFASNPAADGTPRVLSCKMRTAERINAIQGPGQAAASDSDCAEVQRQLLADVAARVPPAEQVRPPESFSIVEDDMTWMGPMWLEPWPFEPVTVADEGGLRLQSRALYVPHAWWIPMPERFLGNHYCHLAAPAYLEALLRGSLQP